MLSETFQRRHAQNKTTSAQGNGCHAIFGTISVPEEPVPGWCLVGARGVKCHGAASVVIHGCHLQSSWPTEEGRKEGRKEPDTVPERAMNT